MTPWTAAHQAPLSTGLSRQKYWSGLPFPTPWDLPDPGFEPSSLASPAISSGCFTTAPPGKPKPQPIHSTKIQGVQDHKAYLKRLRLDPLKSSQHKLKTDMGLSRKDMLRSILSDGVSESESCSVVPHSLQPPFGSLQARILEWVAIPFSRGSSQHRD